MTDSRLSARRLSRRILLRGALLLVASAFLVACAAPGSAPAPVAEPNRPCPSCVVL